ncbi:hypothetical protein [Alkalihalobacillus sp. AL-G]|uniref:hypothetical protein n=1 Tax=Alkalihalobacillus sp. AL-G TaxID=2926399 RepID=UPI00272D1595|nr:hypothetical protein [Alkalihalobacillus sp. AL-G]WLD92551.1 hypothetical protein MOJ78_16250 [Alkalihalobacillus sp. AL-G]
MPMEEEIMGMLVGGFSIVIGITILLTIFFFLKSKRKGYLFVLMHFLLFSTAGYFLLHAMRIDPNHQMASEESSLQLGIAGVIWAASMVFLIIGLYTFSVKKTRLKL